jgi:class 3 adenylate cyclase
VKDLFGAIAQLWRTAPRLAARTWADTVDRGRYPELCAQLATMIAQSTNPHDAAASIEELLRHDVTDLLPHIQAPTLVIHRRGDHSNPIASAQGIAARISKARLVMLEGDAHWYSMDPGGGLLGAILAFLPEGQATRLASVQPAGSLRTVLFTDIVGHTEMMQRLGDAKGRDVLREHERITRETLKQHGGAEVKTMGDGFMASFGSVTSAMECAIALQRAFAAWNDGGGAAPREDGAKASSLHDASLDVRVGLNAGEPIEEDGDLFGATVILASRIAAKAGAGEILVPDTVRGLLSGKGFMFSNRGEFVPKGFDEGVRLWDVRWREDS